MEINKSNIRKSDMRSLSIHDTFIRKFVYQPSTKCIEMYFEDIERKIEFIVSNVFEFAFSSSNSYSGMFENQIYDWEEITDENYLADVKLIYKMNNGDWDDDLFAIRVLFCDQHEIRIICSSLSIRYCSAVVL